MNIYSWEIDVLVKHILHPLLRKPKMEGLLLSFLAPLNSLHNDFLAYVAQKRYELDFTGQVISMERLLNDQFDNVSRRIYITDGNREEVFIFKGDAPIGQEAFFFKGSGTGEAFAFKGVSNLLHDFVINVPASLAYDTAKLRALVDKYKLAGKKYIIQTF